MLYSQHPSKSATSISREARLLSAINCSTKLEFSEPLFLELQVFLLKVWQQRATERLLRQPVDLSYACKFCSLFAVSVLGGELAGNQDHQFSILADGRVIDFTRDSEFTKSLHMPYLHDESFWLNKDHFESLQSIIPRVNDWLLQYLRPMRSITTEHSPERAPTL